MVNKSFKFSNDILITSFQFLAHEPCPQHADSLIM